MMRWGLSEAVGKLLRLLRPPEHVEPMLIGDLMGTLCTALYQLHRFL